MKCGRFCNMHCSSGDCPNIQCDTADEMFGYGIAEDMGLERIKCRDCIYSDSRCTCADCYFSGGNDCPKNGGESGENND